MRNIIFAALILTSLILINACSGGEDIPVIPGSTSGVAASETTTSCWGMWQCVVDWDAGTLDLAPLRQADKALNIVSLLEPPAGPGAAYKRVFEVSRCPN